jgi:DNA polymerase-3 subunit delta
MSFCTLYGEEWFLVEERLADLKSKMLGFEGVTFEGKVDLQSVIDFLSNVSMFSPGKYAVLKSPSVIYGEGDEGTLQKLNAIKSIVSDRACVIILSEKPLDMRKKLSVWLKKNTNMEAFEGFKDWEQDKLKVWLKHRFNAIGLSCDMDAIDMLVEFSGNSLRFLAGEVSKLAVYVGVRQQVSVSDVEMVCQRGSVSLFAFQDAVRARSPQSVAMLKRLLDDGEEPVMLVSMMVNQLRLFYQILEMSQRRVSVDDIAKKTGKNPFYIKKLIPQLQNRYAIADLGKAIGYFAEADIAIKTGQMKPRNALEVAWVKAIA